MLAAKKKIIGYILLSISLFVLFIITLVYFESTRVVKMDHSVYVKITNETDQAIVVLFFPITLSSKEVIEKSNFKQARLEKEESESYFYYPGKTVDTLKNIIICVAIWKVSDEMDHLLFEKKPYLVKTFYKPEFKLGPDEYGYFAEIVVE